MSIKTGFRAVGTAFTLWWQDWTNQVLVCLAAILLSLTVVLYPAALFGVFTQARDLTHGLRTGIAGFWLGFKQDFKNNLVWGLINTILVALLGLNIWFYANTQSSIAPFLVLFSALLALFWLSWQFFALACLFLQEEKSLKLAWKNGLAVMLNHPAHCLVIVLVYLVLLGLSVRFFIPLFLGSESLICLLALVGVQSTLKSNA